MNRFINPIVKTVLRSPAHRPLSGNTMLITVEGHKTGHKYTTPVNYVRDGDELTVVSRRDRTWWRNVSGGAPITVRLRGRVLTGRAEVAPAGGYDLIPAYMAYRKKLGHPVSPTTAEQLARDIVMIKVELDAEDS
jgi:deazaflavin-dependent oxidoreductase (nitroreductase family)